MVYEPLDLEDIFLVFLNSIGIKICCREVLTTTTFSATSAPKTSLVLVFLVCLALLGRRLLVLAIQCISGESVSRFSLSKVFFLLLCRPVFLETPWVHLVNTGK